MIVNLEETLRKLPTERAGLPGLVKGSIVIWFDLVNNRRDIAARVVSLSDQGAVVDMYPPSVQPIILPLNLIRFSEGSFYVGFNTPNRIAAWCSESHLSRFKKNTLVTNIFLVKSRR